MTEQQVYAQRSHDPHVTGEPFILPSMWDASIAKSTAASDAKTHSFLEALTTNTGMTIPPQLADQLLLIDGATVNPLIQHDPEAAFTAQGATRIAIEATSHREQL